MEGNKYHFHLVLLGKLTLKILQIQHNPLQQRLPLLVQKRKLKEEKKRNKVREKIEKRRCWQLNTICNYSSRDSDAFSWPLSHTCVHIHIGREKNIHAYKVIHKHTHICTYNRKKKKGKRKKKFSSHLWQVLI